MATYGRFDGDSIDNDWINVLSFNADPGGSVDSAAALQRAIDHADAAGATLLVPSGTYLTSLPLTSTGAANILMEGKIRYSGSANVVVLTIGDGTSRHYKTHRLWVDRQSISDWSSTDSVGIRIVNLNSSDIHIMECSSSTIGLQLMGDGAGIAYNNVRLGQIAENKYGIDLTEQNSGWCNENVFIGGRISNGVSGNPSESRYGVRISSASGAVYNNGNIFYSPSFELNPVGVTSEGHAVLIEYGRRNRFLDCRYEPLDTTHANTPQFAVISNDSRHNVFTLATDLPDTKNITIDDNSGWGNNYFAEREQYRRGFSPERELRLYDDWAGHTVSSCNDWATTASGTGAAATVISEAGSPGILNLTTGTTSAGDTVVEASGNAFGTGKYLVFEARVRIPTLDHGTHKFVVRVGMTEGGGGNPTDAIQFLYDGTAASDGVWKLRTINASDINDQSSSDTVVANQWYHLRWALRADGAALIWAIDGVEQTAVSTDIPSAMIRPNIQILKTAGTTARTLDVDYIHVYQSWPNGR